MHNPKKPAGILKGENIVKIKGLLYDLGFLFISSVLFALSFPNFINSWGFFPLAYIAVIPAFYVINKSGWVSIFFYGIIYALMSYSIFNFWLIGWHPLAIFVIPPIYAFYFIFLFQFLLLS